VIVKGARVPAVEHIYRLAERERRKVFAFLERTAHSGPLGYTEDRSKKLTDHILELKPTSEVRLLYFFDGRNRLVITHGFTKKRGRTPPAEIRRAESLRAEYLAQS
jgi:phage-related protein